MVQLERDDIQGFVMSGYGHMHRAAYLLLRVGEAAGDAPRARAWLGDLAPRLTTSEAPERERCLQVAFTGEGLRALGVHADDLATFPAPFREGMAVEHRTRILGDTGGNHPRGWAWGGPGGKPVHVLLLVFARDDATFASVEAEERALLDAAGLEVVRQLTPERLPGLENVGKFGVEHFGFADGMSQPVVRGSGQEAKLSGDDARRHVIEAGEFVLGYPNGYAKLTPWPKLATEPDGGADFGRNGTYLVFRHLAQDVGAFREFLRSQSADPDGRTSAEEELRLAAKLVGRWQSGAPLVKGDHRDDPDLGLDNSFGYAEWDPHGLRCPIASHVRRTNPRDSLGSKPDKALELANLHRILRRGRVFGPPFDDPHEGDVEPERGLHFICLNANIERQFEFIQHTWCNNPKFAGRYDEQDPLITYQPDGGGRLTIQQTPVRRRVVDIPSFVTTRGGAYFFLPGIRAVRQLGALAG